MTDPIIFYDIEFHFTSGALLTVTIQDGKDRVRETEDQFALEMLHEDGNSTILKVQRDKLNAVQTHKRIVQPEPAPVIQ